MTAKGSELANPLFAVRRPLLQVFYKLANALRCLNAFVQRCDQRQANVIPARVAVCGIS